VRSITSTSTTQAAAAVAVAHARLQVLGRVLELGYAEGSHGRVRMLQVPSSRCSTLSLSQTRAARKTSHGGPTL